MLCYYEGRTFIANGGNLLLTVQKSDGSTAGNNACIDPQWQKDFEEQADLVTKERQKSNEMDEKVARIAKEAKRQQSKRACLDGDVVNVVDSDSDDEDLTVHTKQLIQRWSSPSASFKRQRKMCSGRKEFPPSKI